ncbi:MAG: NFACT family protein [Synergistaceae bacterium]|jgi:predicted ribosome quality control (RQC) complex YloA/Tae2 family protein|nr:NFACT family protein [Synergistaceae bacterium]
MSFGPEYIHALQVALNENFPWRVSKVEGGEAWVALRVAGPDGAARKSPVGAIDEKKGDEWLLLSWGSGSAGCCLADASSVEALKKGAPARTPLAEALKSRFVKGQIVSARQMNFDRVLELEVVRFVAAGFGVRYFLVLEATEPTGNLVLLNEARKIEELARHASPDRNSYRTLLPGHLYALPPAFEGPLPWELNFLTFEQLSRVKGVGRPLARLIEAHWEERTPQWWLTALRRLYLCEKETEMVPVQTMTCQRTSKGYFTRFPHLFPEAKPVEKNQESDEGNGVFSAAREGVLSPLLAGLRSRLLRDLDARIGRSVKSKERHLDGLSKQLKNNAEAELFRRKGELLLANIAAIPPLADKIELSEWSGQVLEIALDPKLSPARNAERYFKKYKKARVDPQKIQEEAASLRGAIQELREQKDLLASIENPAKLEEAVRDVVDWLSPPAGKSPGKTVKNAQKTQNARKRAKDKDLPPHLRIEIGEYTVFVGLSARGNRFVTFRQAAADDLWLHAHELPGAHVVVKGVKRREELEREPDRNEILAFAASLAAGHSRGKDSVSVQVDYTERRYVRSVPGAAIALVTYANPGTIRVDPNYWKQIRQTL